MSKNSKIIILEGRVPSKKNSRNIFCRGNKPINIPSKDYADWHEEKMWELKKHKPKVPLKEVDVFISFTPGDNRTFDLTNKAESIMDLLVDAGILEDDNWSVVGRLDLRIGDLQKGKPKTIIEIV